VGLFCFVLEDKMSELQKDQVIGNETPGTEIPEIGIEIKFERKYNLGDWNHKIFDIKISGTNKVVEEWLRHHKARLSKYIREVDILVSEAHETNMRRAAAEAALAQAAETQAQAPQGEQQQQQS
jgi:hypothetical protein